MSLYPMRTEMKNMKEMEKKCHSACMQLIQLISVVLFRPIFFFLDFFFSIQKFQIFFIIINMFNSERTLYAFFIRSHWLPFHLIFFVCFSFQFFFFRVFSLAVVFSCLHSTSLFFFSLKCMMLVRFFFRLSTFCSNWW